MNLLLETPSARRSRMILIIAVSLGLALAPAVDRLVQRWMPSSAPESPSSSGSTQWDMRSMWY